MTDQPPLSTAESHDPKQPGEDTLQDNSPSTGAIPLNPVKRDGSDFDNIATDLQYQQALRTVEHLIQKLELAPRERAELNQELQQLDRLHRKLAQTILQIGVFGMVGRGKSSLLNALIGQTIFTTGPLHGVTQRAKSIAWQTDGPADQVLRVTFGGESQSRVELVDTPGIDEVDGESRQQIAETVAAQVDLILFVISADLTQVEYDALVHLRQAGKPVIVVLNKIDQYSPDQRQQIQTKVQTQIANLKLTADDIVITAADPLVTQVIQQGQNRQLKRTRGPAQVEALKLKMLNILARDGKALVALNTLLYADTLNEQLIARKLEIRQRSADDVIWQAVLTKALAVAVNPVLVLDVMGGAAVDIVLITTLARLYGLEINQTGAVKLLKSIAIAMGGLTASELLITFGLSSLKSLLGASSLATGGLTLSPYVSVALTQAGVAGVSTYAIGQVTQTYLAQGATWGPEGPKAAINQILDTLDEASILTKIKAEVRQRLQGSSRLDGA